MFTGNVGNTTSLVASAAAGTYFVRVRGVNADGMSAASNEVIAVIGGTAPCVAPVPPTGINFLVTGATVMLGWSASPNTTSYQLDAGTAPGLSNVFSGDVGNITTLSAVALPGTYFVRLRSRNACGVGAPSPEIVNTVGATLVGTLTAGDDGGVRGRVMRFVGPACNQFAFAGFTAPGSVIVEDNSVRITVPLAMLGNDDGRMTFKVSTFRALGGDATTAILDRMSNPGLPPGMVPNP